MPFIKGYLIEAPEGADPGYGQGHPLPPHVGGGPVYPPGPVDPSYGIPLPPVIWPNPPSPVDPGWGQGHPRPPGHISGGPVRPTYPVDPGYDIPLLPVIWPRPPINRPGHPLPPSPGHPDGGPADPPGRPPQVGGGPVEPRPPHVGHPLPPAPVHPELPIYYPPEGVDPPPGAVWPPLPPVLDGVLVAFVWIPGVGYRWVVIDTNVSIDNTLPPTPEPKG